MHHPANVPSELESLANEEQQDQVVEAHRHSGDAPGQTFFRARIQCWHSDNLEEGQAGAK